MFNDIFVSTGERRSFLTPLPRPNPTPCLNPFTGRVMRYAKRGAKGMRNLAKSLGRRLSVSGAPSDKVSSQLCDFLYDKSTVQYYNSLSNSKNVVFFFRTRQPLQGRKHVTPVSSSKPSTTTSPTPPKTMMTTTRTKMI